MLPAAALALALALAAFPPVLVVDESRSDRVGWFRDCVDCADNRHWPFVPHTVEVSPSANVVLKGFGDLVTVLTLLFVSVTRKTDFVLCREFVVSVSTCQLCVAKYAGAIHTCA